MLEDLLIREAAPLLDMSYKTLMGRVYRGVVESYLKNDRRYLPSSQFIELQKEILRRKNKANIAIGEAAKKYAKSVSFFQRKIKSGKLTKIISNCNKRGLLKIQEIEELLGKDIFIINNRSSLYSVSEIAELYRMSKDSARRRIKKISHVKNSRGEYLVFKHIIEKMPELFILNEKYSQPRIRESTRNLNGSFLITKVVKELRIPYSTLRDLLLRNKIGGFKDYNGRLRINKESYSMIKDNIKKFNNSLWIRDAVKELGVSHSTLRRWLLKKKITGFIDYRGRLMLDKNSL